ncbi:MAG: AMP-binding protein, partial [Algicola sp.]|nr:AMP-binding protein [Algicola sp.]
VAHQTACTLANEMADWPICNTQKSWGWNANVVFDASIHGLLRLCMGQQVVVLPNDAKLMPQQLVQIVADENIGVIDCTPSMVAMWFNAQVADRLPNLVIGGEAIGDKLWQQLVDWQNAGESRKAVNIYGPTECCVNITCHPVAGKQPTIGRPLGHVKSYLTDAALRLAPKGVVAELLIGGPCVTQGYLNQPGLTAQRFIQNPFSDDPQDCLYRTGDLVRYLEDGNLAYVGRSDDQLKIRGYRIEAGEVQSQLDRCDNVRGSVVIADAGQQRLVAYVVTCGERKGKSDESQGDFITDLKTRLRTRLPHYMVPDVIILLASFVLTSNGKIDKKSLPPIDDGIKWGQYVAAKNHQQQTLVVIWAALLGLDCARIGIDDNFFQLGGHSLLAVELAIRVSNRFNCSVTINDVFRCRTIAQLAAYLEHAPQSTLKLEITTVERDPDKPPLASFAQQRLYFISLQDKESAKYNLPCAWLVSGAFLPDIAEQALANIITCHESLRTNFANQQMTTVQIINPCTDFKLTRVDLTGLSSQRTEQRLAHLMRADANTAFCLERDLMLRASFVQLTKGRGVLLINIHHIATDGWSNNLLIKAFNEHYQMLVQGINVPSPPLSIQYADFTHSQRRWIADGHFESQLVYWEKQLAGLPEVHSLPINAARQTEPIAAGGRFVQKVSEQTLSSLSQIAKDNNASLFMLLHGSFALLLSRYSNCEDIVVAIPTANRLQQQLSPLIGFFVNTLALRIDCSLDCDFEAFLNAVKTVHLDGQANQAMPFDLVVDRLKPNRSHTYSPLFQFMFAMNTNETTRLDLPGLDIEMLDNQPSEAKFELSATVEQSAQGLNVEFSYNSALFDGDFIEQLAGHYGYLLGAVARGPKCNIHELPLWPQSHTKQLIAQINRR